MKTTRKSAFTLVELLTVISILAVLYGMSSILVHVGHQAIGKLKGIQAKHEQSIQKGLRDIDADSTATPDASAGAAVSLSPAAAQAAADQAVAHSGPAIQTQASGWAVNQPVATASNSADVRRWAEEVVSENPPQGTVQTDMSFPQNW